MKAVTIYFDYASPWSYLVSELVSRKLAGAEINWIPIYIRGLPAFANGLPYVDAKLMYAAQDLVRVAEHEGVPCTTPVSFPVNAIHGLRAALVAKEHSAEAFARYHVAAFRAVWRDKLDIADPSVVAKLLYDSVHAVRGDAPNAEELSTTFSSQRFKDQLRANTEAAVARGVFGLPMFFVGDEMFWGLDRIDYVARAAARR